MPARRLVPLVVLARRGWRDQDQFGQHPLLGLQAGHVQPPDLLQITLPRRVRPRQLVLELLDLHLGPLPELGEERLPVALRDLLEALRVGLLPVPYRHAAVLVHRARVRALPRGLRRKAAGRRYSPSGVLAASPHPLRSTAAPTPAMHVITRLRSSAYVVSDESASCTPSRPASARAASVPTTVNAKLWRAPGLTVTSRPVALLTASPSRRASAA